MCLLLLWTFTLLHITVMSLLFRCYEACLKIVNSRIPRKAVSVCPSEILAMNGKFVSHRFVIHGFMHESLEVWILWVIDQPNLATDCAPSHPNQISIIEGNIVLCQSVPCGFVHTCTCYWKVRENDRDLVLVTSSIGWIWNQSQCRLQSP